MNPLRAARGRSPASLTHSKLKNRRALWARRFFKWGGNHAVNPTSRPPLEVAKFIRFQAVPPYKNPDFLRQKYLEERLSCKEIAGLISSSRSTVTKYLKQYGIPLRSADTGYKSKSQLGYGQKWRKRKIEVHLGEQETIARMQNLRAEGLSYREIAATLNALKIPTKTQKGKWTGKQVHQILQRLEKNGCLSVRDTL